jgi:hypothetical protein
MTECPLEAESEPEAGSPAQRVSDVFSESRASWLAEGFENAAPLGLSKHGPASPLSCLLV